VPQAKTLTQPIHPPATGVRRGPGLFGCSAGPGIPFLVLPTALWRLAWVFELPVGWDPVLFAENTDDPHEKVYLLGLTVLALG